MMEQITAVISQYQDTIIGLTAAWLILFGAAIWSQRLSMGLEKPFLWSSLRGLVQLLALAFVLHAIFGLESHWAQALVILVFCLIAAWNSAGHAEAGQLSKLEIWCSVSVGLAVACLITLPWLAFAGSIDNSTRALIPLGSMIAANGMNAVSLMLATMKRGEVVQQGIEAAMIPSVDTLKMVGLVHMPGIFVGMILAGSTPMEAASAQLIVLYMIVASNFSACIVSFLMMSYFKKMKV